MIKSKNIVKLSELKDDEIIMNDMKQTYTVKEVRNDPSICNNKLYTTREYEAHIDARSMLESALESEWGNMYEDWYERVLDDITSDDVDKIQEIIDNMLSRNEEQNTSYWQMYKIDVES